MKTVSLEYAQKNIHSLISSNEPVRIESAKGNQILLSEREHNSLLETIHLMTSPQNADRLQESIEQLKSRHTNV